jgi:hypothetical protein
MEMKDLLTAIDEAGRGPESNDLENAPVLTFWWLMADGNLLRAQGDLSGHPTISDPFVTTSPVLGFDAEAGWMRTRSRWYRLGPPADPEHLMTINEAAQRLLAAMRIRVGRERKAEG